LLLLIARVTSQSSGNVDCRFTTTQKEDMRMDDYLKGALEIAKAQAGVRAMTEEEITAMVSRLASGLKSLAEGVAAGEDYPLESGSVAPEKSIKEKSIVCLECGETFKLLSKKHLATHGLDRAGYCEKWGLKKGTALVCKGLRRERRNKMKDMKLWERRLKANG
jgi:predicted transcriptional regulator